MHAPGAEVRKLFPVFRAFGSVEELWDATGKPVAQIAKRPLRVVADTSDDAPGFGGRGADGPKRGLAWMPAGSGMYFVEAVPGARRDTSDAAAPAAGPTVTSCMTNSGPDGVQRPSIEAKLTGRCTRWLSCAATHAGCRASSGNSSCASAAVNASMITQTPATQPSARAQPCSRRCHDAFTRDNPAWICSRRIYSKTTSNCSCE